eukprot:90815_1
MMLLVNFLILCFTLFSFAVSLPHILFICIDDLGYTDLGYHGAEFNTTNLDSLALSGIDLTNYYVQLACTPTRTSFVTGKYPWRIGMQNPATMWPGVTAHIPFDTPTIAEQMKIAGYNTQYIGKWHVGYGAMNMTPTGRGWDDYYGFYLGAEDYYYHNVSGGFDLVYNNIPQQQSNGTYTSDLFFGYFNNYLLKHYDNNFNQKPLFMYLALQTIHAPIQKPPLINMNHMNMSDLYNKNCGHINDQYRMWYCQKLQYVDVYIGDIINLYKKLNMWNDTLLIVTTDNGAMPNWNATGIWNVSDGRSVGQNYPLRAGKMTLFQGGVLGLAFVSGPLIPQTLIGTKNNNLFDAIDWFPSILSFIGYNDLIPNNLDGRNIMKSLLNNETFNRSSIILFENFDIEEDISDGSLIEGAIINNEWKYIHGGQPYNCYYPHPPNTIICLHNESVSDKYLFNIKHDPFEANNLVEKYPEIVTFMIDLMVEDA